MKFVFQLKFFRKKLQWDFFTVATIHLNHVCATGKGQMVTQSHLILLVKVIIVYYSIGFTESALAKVGVGLYYTQNFNAGFVKPTLQYFLVYFVKCF